jgi:hypothetical protein
MEALGFEFKERDVDAYYGLHEKLENFKMQKSVLTN